MNILSRSVLILGIVALLVFADADAFEVDNGRFRLRFDDATGALVEAETAEGVRLFGDTSPQVDIKADGEWRFSRQSFPESTEVIRLDGEWDFRIEGGEWRRIRVPGYWERQGVTQVLPDSPAPDWNPYNGTAYYRTTFKALPEWKGKDIAIIIFGVDDEDWTYINGKPIGHTGMDKPEWWKATRLYSIPADALRFDEPNLLEIKVFDRGGDGGIAGSIFIGITERLAARVRNALRLKSRRIKKTDESTTLEMLCAADDYQLRLEYELPRRGDYFRWRARWRYTGDEPTRIDRLKFTLPAVCIRRAEDCDYTLPDLFPPREIPFAELHSGSIRKINIWGSVFPVVVVRNSKLNLSLTAGFYTEDDAFSLQATEQRDSLRIDFEISSMARLNRHDDIEIGDAYVFLSGGDLNRALSRGRDILRLGGFRKAASPDWTRATSIFSTPPGGSIDSAGRDLGEFKNFRKYMLPRLETLGLGVVWFLPVHPGGYAPKDYFTINPRYGTLDDLRDLCGDAHRRGIRVFLDLVPHGPKENSPAGQYIMKNHPEWVTRDEDGSLKYSWGCLACDYAHPEWQDYMAKVATFFVERCDIDGWRVDVAGGCIEPNWKPYDRLRPSQSRYYGGLRLLDTVRRRLIQSKKDAALLGEVCSVMFLTQCDFIYDWSFEHLVCYKLTAMPPDEWVPAAKLWLERQQATLPEGVEFGLMRLLENHDQFRSVRRLGVGYERALLSLCSLIPGVPLVFKEQDIGFGRHIQRLLDIRKKFPEFQRGRAHYTATLCSVPSVFAFTRVHGEGFAVAAINFSSRAEDVEIRPPLQAMNQQRNAPYAAYEVYAGAALGERPLEKWSRIKLQIPAYGTRVIVFRPATVPAPALPEKPTAGKPPAAAPVKISEQNGCVTVSNAFYRLWISNGLISKLCNSRGAPLLTYMNIVEGTRKFLSGERLDFLAQVRETKPQIARKGGATRIHFEGILQRDEKTRLPWQAVYEVSDGPEIGVSLSLEPPRVESPVRAQLGLDLQFAEATEWRVNTFEGKLHDYFAVTHPLGDMMPGWRYWHRSGLLYESTLFPLDYDNPILAARANDTWLNIALPPFLQGFENAYLRERATNGNEGLTLHLAWLDEKGMTTLGKPLMASFKLRVGGEPPPPSGKCTTDDWQLRTESSRYIFRNRHYELIICRGHGGGIVRFALPEGESVVTSSQIYSDRGIFPSRRNPIGKEVHITGYSRDDFEPDMHISRNGEGLTMNFNSFLRSSYKKGTDVIGNPRVQYRLKYNLDGSPRVRVLCATRPMMVNPKLNAFLAHTLTIRNAKRWRVTAAKGELGGEFSTRERRGRVWQSAERPLAKDGAIEIELLDGSRLVFSEIGASQSDVQNIFILDAGSNSAALFFAFLDGKQVSYAPRWLTVKYAMELEKP